MLEQDFIYTDENIRVITKKMRRRQFLLRLVIFLVLAAWVLVPVKVFDEKHILFSVTQLLVAFFVLFVIGPGVYFAWFRKNLRTVRINILVDGIHIEQSSMNYLTINSAEISHITKSKNGDYISIHSEEPSKNYRIYLPIIDQENFEFMLNGLKTIETARPTVLSRNTLLAVLAIMGGVAYSAVKYSTSFVPMLAGFLCLVFVLAIVIYLAIARFSLLKGPAAFLTVILILWFAYFCIVAGFKLFAMGLRTF
jgi:hypothetical protein